MLPDPVDEGLNTIGRHITHHRFTHQSSSLSDLTVWRNFHNKMPYIEI